MAAGAKAVAAAGRLEEDAGENKRMSENKDKEREKGKNRKGSH